MACPGFAECIKVMTCCTTGHVYEQKTIIVDNEHKAYCIVCPRMRKLFEGSVPEEVKSSQQYGVSIKAHIVQLWSQGLMSIERLASIMKGVIGRKISGGTIMDILLKAGALCAESLAKIRSYLSCATFKGADETGLRADGRLMWLHTVCNDNATYLYADRKRGFNAIESDGLLLDARGILIHDCWGSYFKLPNMAHAICLQHIQRELRAAAIREKCHEEYFKQIEDLLLEMRKAKLDAIGNGQDRLDEKILKDFRLLWNERIKRDWRLFPSPGERACWDLAGFPMARRGHYC